MERRHQLGLDSYDRFFPSQDTMPKGGFGNLIALPLQHLPRSHGNSIFLNAELKPYPDQWAMLSSIRRMTFTEVEGIVRETVRNGDLIGVRRSVTDDEQTEDPWTLPPSRKKKDEIIAGLLPAKVRVVRGSLIFCRKGRFSVGNVESAAPAGRISKPRILSCAGDATVHIRQTARHSLC